MTAVRSRSQPHSVLYKVYLTYIDYNRQNYIGYDTTYLASGMAVFMAYIGTLYEYVSFRFWLHSWWWATMKQPYSVVSWSTWWSYVVLIILVLEYFLTHPLRLLLSSNSFGHNGMGSLSRAPSCTACAQAVVLSFSHANSFVHKSISW